MDIILNFGLSHVTFESVNDEIARLGDKRMCVSRTDMQMCKRILQVPQNVRLLERLHVLDISFNNVSVLPQWIGELRKLRKLILFSTPITRLP